jgi:hypothetical protein
MGPVDWYNIKCVIISAALSLLTTVFPLERKGGRWWPDVLVSARREHAPVRRDVQAVHLQQTRLR